MGVQGFADSLFGIVQRNRQNRIAEQRVHWDEEDRARKLDEESAARSLLLAAADRGDEVSAPVEAAHPTAAPLSEAPAMLRTGGAVREGAALGAGGGDAPPVFRSPFQVPVPLDPTRSPFKVPKNFVTGAPFLWTQSPRKMDAAGEARARSVEDLHRRNKRLLYVDELLSPADQLRLAASGEYGQGLLKLVQHRYGTQADLSRAALSAAASEFNELGQDRRHSEDLEERRLTRAETTRAHDLQAAGRARSADIAAGVLAVRRDGIDPTKQGELAAARQAGKFEADKRSGKLEHQQAVQEAKDTARAARASAKDENHFNELRARGRGGLVTKYGGKVSEEKLKALLGEYDRQTKEFRPRSASWPPRAAAGSVRSGGGSASKAAPTEEQDLARLAAMEERRAKALARRKAAK